MMRRLLAGFAIVAALLAPIAGPLAPAQAEIWLTSPTSSGGGGGTPGGSPGQIQWNNAGAFDGISGWSTSGGSGVAGGNLALGGATIGSNNLAVTGTTLLTGAVSVPSGGVSIGGATIGTNALAVTGTSLLSGALTLNASAAVGSSATSFGTSANAIVIFNAGTLSWTSGSSVSVGQAVGDVVLQRDAANTLALRNSTTAQKSRVYQSWTDASNGSWIEIDAGAVSGTAAQIIPKGNGTGASAWATFDVGFSTTKLIRQDGTNTTIFGQNLIWGTDNTYDIGASGATRPRNVFVGSALTAGTTIKTGGYTVSTLPAGTVGMRAYVTDQTTACPATGAALTGTGAVTCPVFYNGSAWVGG